MSLRAWARLPGLAWRAAARRASAVRCQAWRSRWLERRFRFDEEDGVPSQLDSSAVSGAVRCAAEDVADEGAGASTGPCEDSIGGVYEEDRYSGA